MGENIGMSTDIGKYGLSSKMPAWFLVVCSIVWSWRGFFSVLKHVSLWPSYQDQDGEQDEEYETEEQLQARILNAALEFVPLHGWSAEAIAAGAEVRRELGAGSWEGGKHSKHGSVGLKSADFHET